MIWIQGAMLPEKNRMEDVLVDDGRIKYIGKDKIAEYLKGRDIRHRVVGAEGLYLLPSFVDSHFHLRNPGFEYKQTYEEASDACMKGGYTDVIAMANTKPTVDTCEVLREIKEKSSKFPLNVYQVGSVTKGLMGKELVDFESLMKETAIFSDDGKNIDDENIMKRALALSKELGFLIMDHSEPETEMVIRNLKLAEEVGGNLHFCHISKKGSVEAIVKAKEKGLHVTLEVTPHHIFSHGLSYRVNPPIATNEDRLFLIEAIKRGYIDYIGTDHAPHTHEDKEKGAPGIINIENAYSMIRKVFYDNNIGFMTMIELMATRPATLVNKERGIWEGLVADLILVSDGESKIDTEKFATRSKNTPFEGREVKGEVELTMVKGEVVYDNAGITTESLA